MALYVLSDLHLSIGIDKPMDIFEGWEGYLEKLIYNWNQKISNKDTVVLAGDFCWGKTLEGGLPSFKFVNKLPGTKILLKGNHDYWWTTKSKIDKFFLKHNLNTLNILHNNSYLVENICVCGTRGWMFENGEEFNIKLINREVQRLKFSIESGLQYNLPIVVFLHYPPIYGNQLSSNIIQVLKTYNITKCYYGHLHGESVKTSVNSVVDGIEYNLVSCDYVNFEPVKIS